MAVHVASWLAEQSVGTPCRNSTCTLLITVSLFFAQGLKDVHNMLVEVARSLVAGGETGVFTPMHLLLFHKPAEAGKK